MVAVASNPDAAFHAARGFGKAVFIPPNEESEMLGGHPIEVLSAELAEVPKPRFEEIMKTLHSWGIRNCGEFANLPSSGVSERLGPEGLRLHQFATGIWRRSLISRKSERTFARSMELDHPVRLLEPLLFLFAGLLHELCADLKKHSLAASGMHIDLKLPDSSDWHFEFQFLQQLQLFPKHDNAKQCTEPSAPEDGKQYAAGRIVWFVVYRCRSCGPIFPTAPKHQSVRQFHGSLEAFMI
jgi:hypothetical protein